MRSGRIKILAVIVVASLLTGGCAMGGERRVDLKAIGKDACKDHGGLSTIEYAGRQAIFSCKVGMTYMLNIEPPSPSSVDAH